MDLDRWPNLIAMFFDQAERLGGQPFVWAKRHDAWQSVSWDQAADQAMRLADALTAIGVTSGNRVLLVADNGPEWAIADFAILAAGGITVPAYTTNTARDHHHLLTDSGASVAIVSTAALARPLLEAAADALDLKHVIAIDPPDADVPAAITLSLWRDAMASPPKDPDEIKARAAEIAPTALACLIYTSGTGGAPKGVMLSHRAIMTNCVGAYNLLLEVGLGDEVFLSFLPLSHSYEHSCGLMFPVSIGAQIYYAEGVETLAANLVEVRPTIMTSVPRLYEVMRQRILQGVKRAGGLKATMFHKAVALGRKRLEGKSLGVGERLVDALLDKLVRDKVRGRFGGQLKAMVSGGAPLNYDVGVFFSALGLRLLQGYGQTEAAPVVSCNPPRKIKLETVGPPLKDVEVKIADDGEILVRGTLLMDGYWNQQKITEETLRDGWLHTGDIGEFDRDGYIKITDRKKDIIVMSGGDNISPQRIEGILCLEPEIGQAMVAGDGKPHLVSIIVPDESFVHEWCRKAGGHKDLTDLKTDAAFRDAIGEAVARANDGLSVIEKVKRFMIADEAFTTDNALMTPTMKVRRHAVFRRYGDEIDALF